MCHALVKKHAKCTETAVFMQTFEYSSSPQKYL
jgi:hypothetical protein